MKVLTGVKSLLTAVVAAAGLVALAKPSVEIKNVSLANARDGQVNYSYKVDGDLEEGKVYDLLIKVSVANGTKSTIVKHESVTVGTVTTNVNVKTLFGKAYPNVTLFAELKTTPQMDGVQLWEGGPIWADRNVGAESPEETGYYFWWGDTVGYKRNTANNGWVSVDGKGTIIDFNGNNELAKPTYLKSETQLKAEGWIDEDNNNLVAEHDAARVHLGRGWRMPTYEEVQMLVANCTQEAATDWKGTGKAGRVLRGKGNYSTKEIFFPLTGNGLGTNLSSPEKGYFWTSTPTFDAGDHYAWNIGYTTGALYYYTNIDRFIGLPIRPVKDAE